MSEARARSRRPTTGPRPPVSRTPVPRPPRRDWAGTVWQLFSDPHTVGWLAILSGIGVGASVLLETGAVRDGLASAARWNHVVARLHAFFELHAPWRSWWLVVLLGALLLSAVAALVEHRARLTLAARRAQAGAPLAARPGAEAAARMAAALGPDARIAVDSDGYTVGRVPRALDTGVAVAVTGFAVLLVALGLEYFGGFGGELRLVPGTGADRVQLPGPPGEAPTARLGFSVQLRGADPASGRTQVSFLEGGRPVGQAELGPGATARHAGVCLALREVQPVPGGERFQLRLLHAERGASQDVTAGFGDPIPFEGSTFVVEAFEPDVGGQGPALRVARTDGAGAVDRWWSFQRHPGFDRRNRGGPWSVEVRAVDQRHEAILAAERHPGALPAAGGGLLLAAGLALAWAGAGRGVAVRLSRGLARGVPADDPKVRRALQAAAEPSPADEDGNAEADGVDA